MPTAFSLTAPCVTDEDEKKELEELCEEELAALHEDVHGGPLTKLETVIPPHVYEEARRLLREAINSMEPSKKAAYELAQEQCPHLVERESPTRLYLETTKLDVWTAAENIAAYWKFRLSLFGTERAFLPMTLNGAMANDEEILEHGYFISAPDDNHGRPVIFYDRTRFTTNDKEFRQKIFRCFFYFEQTRLERQRGYVAIINARDFDVYKHYDRIFTKTVLAINAAFPGEVKAIHVCMGNGRPLINLVLPAYKHLLGKRMRMRFVLHGGTSLQALNSMKHYGLTEGHVDAVFGGMLRNQKCALEWIKTRKEIEQQSHVKK
mmetsp:Transcript_26076/g.71804  ORF Transcript_26076/g.71804 Transcript_26076/m.71804 type:complete len:321 (-) Transcript_26076:2172-3134(-)